MPIEVITNLATGEVTTREYEHSPEEQSEIQQAALDSWRAGAVCSQMQGKLALGPVEWAKIETYRDTEATWAQRVVIDSANEWRRNSQDIQFFGYLLGYADEQMDDMFARAMAVEA